MYPSPVHDLTCHFHVFCVLKRHRSRTQIKCKFIRTCIVQSYRTDLGQDSRLGSGLPTIGSSDSRWDFRRPQSLRRLSDWASGLPAWVVTSDCREFRLTSGLLTPTVTEKIFYVLECLSFDFIFMLEHYIFLRPTKFASLFIVRQILNSKTKIKPLESAYWVIATTYLIKITLVPNLDVINTPKPT